LEHPDIYPLLKDQCHLRLSPVWKQAPKGEVDKKKELAQGDFMKSINQLPPLLNPINLLNLNTRDIGLIMAGRLDAAKDAQSVCINLF